MKCEVIKITASRKSIALPDPGYTAEVTYEKGKAIETDDVLLEIIHKIIQEKNYESRSRNNEQTA